MANSRQSSSGCMFSFLWVFQKSFFQTHVLYTLFPPTCTLFSIIHKHLLYKRVGLDVSVKSSTVPGMCFDQCKHNLHQLETLPTSAHMQWKTPRDIHTSIKMHFHAQSAPLDSGNSTNNLLDVYGNCNICRDRSLWVQQSGTKGCQTTIH